jgi:hypothetical protein
MTDRHVMDVTQLLMFWDDFKGKHSEECGVENLDVSLEREESATRFTLKCPHCGRTTSGSIQDVDMPILNELINPRKAN